MVEAEGSLSGDPIESDRHHGWYAQWANVMEITVTPCVEDAEAGPILAAMAQRH